MTALTEDAQLLIGRLARQLAADERMACAVPVRTEAQWVETLTAAVGRDHRDPSRLMRVHEPRLG